MATSSAAHPPIVVVGAGAAGLVAAIFARRGQHPVVLLEATRDGGRKILVSGGGRCNVLPSELAPERFVTASSVHTLKKMLLSWPLAEQRRFFEREVGVPLALEASTGKLFPASNRARDVRDGLLRLAREHGVELRCGAAVTDLEPPHGPGGTWTVRAAGVEPIQASAVVVATGGLSMPGTGSDGTGLEFLRRLGHTVKPTYPALVPLLADPAPHAHLAGISLDVTLRARGHRRATETGGFLFTHHGYSGPAVLNLSHLAVLSRIAGGPLQPIEVQWTQLDATAWRSELASGPGLVVSSLRRVLPDRLAEQLLAECEMPLDQARSRLGRPERHRLIEVLTAYRLPWTGDEGYARAEVTGGGIELEDVEPRTMESRSHLRLHLCGEVLDAFGPIGGHNFAWAWATGRAAGLGAARSPG
ncbi:MAG: NAD(P)/FAD-dependent oxidoreductase [Acidobacteriota bacterium]